MQKGQFKRILFSAILLCFMAVSGENARAEGMLQIEFSIKGKKEGNIRMAVVAESENAHFARDDAPAFVKKAYPLPADIQTFTTPTIALPSGIYGVSAFLDRNGDKILNRNLVNAPKEPYGFSNNARGNFGPAKFEDTTFTIKDGKKTLLKINLYKHFDTAE